LYINFKWLREWCKKNHVPFPQNGLDEKLKRELSSLTYQIPRRTDSPHAFTDQEKTVYVDRIGGDGLNNNFGSGRAASNGFVQIKGIGTTPLVSAAADFDHAHGGASVLDSAVEAVYAAVNAELPYGSNAVIGIFETGTFAPWDESGEEELAAVVRPDPVRLGAFIPRDPHEGDGHSGDEWHWKAEKKRIQAYKSFIVDALPQPSSIHDNHEKSPREKFNSGTREEARRIGMQTTASYARGNFHATTSASNLLLNGGYLDYGTQTYQPGFARIRYIDEVASAGPEEVEQLMDILPALLKTAPKEVKEGKEGQKLAKNLIKIAHGSAADYNVKDHIPTQLTRFDLRAILTELGNVSGMSKAKMLEALAGEMDNHSEELSEESFQKNFVQQYEDFIKLCAKKAKSDGVTQTSFQTIVREQS